MVLRAERPSVYCRSLSTTQTRLPMPTADHLKPQLVNETQGAGSGGAEAQALYIWNSPRWLLCVKLLRNAAYCLSYFHCSPCLLPIDYPVYFPELPLKILSNAEVNFLSAWLQSLRSPLLCLFSPNGASSLPVHEHPSTHRKAVCGVVLKEPSLSCAGFLEATLSVCNLHSFGIDLSWENQDWRNNKHL